MLLDFLDLVAFSGVKKEMLLERKIKVPALTFADYRAWARHCHISILLLFDRIVEGLVSEVLLSVEEMTHWKRLSTLNFSLVLL